MNTENTILLSKDVEKSNIFKVVLASSVGTLIEWYDMFLAIILANVLSTQLFPNDGSSHFLETLAVVVSSFMVRPIGSLIFGSIGDRIGRKYSFLIALVLMGVATFLIGCIPTFEKIGWLAPVLLLICRIMQGLAISGEYAGAVIYVAEHAPAEKRGFYTGFIQATVPIGLLLCLSIVYITRSFLSEESFANFGWRIPFLFSSILVIFSYFIRKRLHESPIFAQLKKQRKTSIAPIKDSFTTPGNVKLMLKAVFGGVAVQSTVMQTTLFVTLFFLQRAVKLPYETVLIIVLCSTLFSSFFYQIFGGMSDKIGRKPIMLGGMISSFFLIPLSFYLYMKLGNPDGLTEVHKISSPAVMGIIIVSLITSIAGAATYGPLGAFILEIFPTKIRYTSMGFAQNMGNGMIGGATTFITELLKTSFVISASISPYIGLTYPLFLTLIAIIVNCLFVPETYKTDLTQE